jgi:hypothetical protein
MEQLEYRMEVNLEIVAVRHRLGMEAKLEKNTVTEMQREIQKRKKINV